MGFRVLFYFILRGPNLFVSLHAYALLEKEKGDDERNKILKFDLLGFRSCLTPKNLGLSLD